MTVKQIILELKNYKLYQLKFTGIDQGFQRVVFDSNSAWGTLYEWILFLGPFELRKLRKWEAPNNGTTNDEN